MCAEYYLWADVLLYAAIGGLVAAWPTMYGYYRNEMRKIYRGG